MKILGLDISNTTGWSIIEGPRLIDRGIISLNTSMMLPQRLHYFHLELTRIIDKYKPDWVCIEDVFYGISGAKTLSYLARLNGVAIVSSFSQLQHNVKLYTPGHWKSQLNGLKGSAQKWEVQLEVLKHFKISVTGSFDRIYELVDLNDKTLSALKEFIQINRKEVDKLKREIARKRNPITEEEKISKRELINSFNLKIDNDKKAFKKTTNEFNKTMLKISTDIAAQTGMTNDICDSIGVALCGQKELTNG